MTARHLYSLLAVVFAVAATLLGCLTGKAIDPAVAQANAPPAEARNADAAESERNRLELEARLAPRALSESQVTIIVAAIRKLAGTRVHMVQVGDTPELVNYRNMLEGTLRKAGWDPIPVVAMESEFFLGLSLALSNDASASDTAAAELLARAMGAAGIPVYVLHYAFQKGEWLGISRMHPPTDAKYRRGQAAAIRLYVGPKP